MLFCRSLVSELSGDGNVVVEFVDYGNCERVHWEELFELPGDLLNIPLQVKKKKSMLCFQFFKVY